MPTVVESLAADRVLLRVEVSAHDVDHAFEHALRDLSRDVRIPGFRKGKVPPRILRSRLGEEAVIEEALRGHLGSWYARAVTETGIEPADTPEIDYEEPPVEGATWTFTATVAVPTPAALPDELVIEAVRPSAEPPEGAVDEELERLRTNASQLEPTEGAAGRGDHVLVDFRGEIDGKAIKDAAVDDLLVEIGSGRLLDELEASLVGLSAGDERDVDVQFPADYGSKKVAGKAARFHVHVKEVKQRVLPDLDDELARNVSEFDTLAELKASVESEIRERAERNADGRFRAAVLRDLAAKAEIDVPEGLVQRRLQSRIEEIAESFSQRGIPFDRYLQSTGQSPEAVVASLRPEVVEAIRQEQALRAFVDRESIEVSDDEVDAAIRESAAEAKQDADATIARVRANDAVLRELREDLRMKRALDRLVEIAVALPEPAGDGAAAENGDVTSEAGEVVVGDESPDENA